MSDPSTLKEELAELAARLDTAARELYKLDKEAEQVDTNYEDTWNDLLVALVDDHEANEKRLPGEDVRNAIITKQIREADPILYGNHRRLRREIERSEKFCKRLEREIEAKRSLLSFAKIELEATA